MPKVEDNFNDGKEEKDAGGGDYKEVDTKGSDPKLQGKAAKLMDVDIEDADDSGDDSSADDFSEDEDQKPEPKSDPTGDEPEDSKEDEEEEDDDEEDYTFSSLPDDDESDDESDEESEDDSGDEPEKKEPEKKADEEKGEEEKKPDADNSDKKVDEEPTDDSKDARAKLIDMQHKSFAEHFEAHKDFYPPEVLTAYKQFQKLGGEAGRVFIVGNEQLNKLDDALQKVSSELPFKERFEIAFNIAFGATPKQVKQAEKVAQAKTEIRVKQVNKVTAPAGKSSSKPLSKHSEAQNKMAKRMGVTLE